MRRERSSDVLASIDLGSHTARLLIARWESGRLKSLSRKRAYTRLAQDFESSESGTLKQAGIGRALMSLGEFKSDIEKYQAKRTRAVATGVVRACAQLFLSIHASQITKRRNVVKMYPTRPTISA